MTHPESKQDCLEKKEQSQKIRTIKSFVRRQGLITNGQKRALDNSPYLLRNLPNDNEKGCFDLDAIFGRTNAYRTLEIGFGNGESLAEMASNAPERDFLGVEVHQPGVGHLLMEIEKRQLSNLRVICHDAVELVEKYFVNDAFDCVQIFFPDPWHKKRHNKRRLIQKPFIDSLLPLLKKQGQIHLATDWEPYAIHMLETLQGIEALENAFEAYAPRPSFRPLTKFEQRGERLGHDVWDLIFIKQ